MPARPAVAALLAEASRRGPGDAAYRDILSEAATLSDAERAEALAPWQPPPSQFAAADSAPARECLGAAVALACALEVQARHANELVGDPELTAAVRRAHGAAVAASLRLKLKLRDQQRRRAS